MDATEYSEMKWVQSEEIIGGNYHPALQRATKDFVAMTKWKQIESLVNQEHGEENNSLKQLLKEFIALKNH